MTDHFLTWDDTMNKMGEQIMNGGTYLREDEPNKEEKFQTLVIQIDQSERVL